MPKTGAPKARVLVVDDNRSAVRALELVLGRDGFEVLTAYDGVEGLEKAFEARPDLIILDVVMPGMDGYEVCRRLQTRRETADIKVIMLTVKGRTNDIAAVENKRIMFRRIHEQIEGFEAGAVEFLTKPITAYEVLGHVKRVLKLVDLGAPKSWVD